MDDNVVVRAKEFAKHNGTRRFLKWSRSISAPFRITPTVDRLVPDQALRLPLADFKDAGKAVAAQAAKCEFIVTRDPKGSRKSMARAISPEEMPALR